MHNLGEPVVSYVVELFSVHSRNVRNAFPFMQGEGFLHRISLAQTFFSAQYNPTRNDILHG